MGTQRASVWALFSLWGIFADGNIFALVAAASLVEIEQKSKWRAHTHEILFLLCRALKIRANQNKATF